MDSIGTSALTPLSPLYNAASTSATSELPLKSEVYFSLVREKRRTVRRLPQCARCVSSYEYLAYTQGRHACLLSGTHNNHPLCSASMRKEAPGSTSVRRRRAEHAPVENLRRGMKTWGKGLTQQTDSRQVAELFAIEMSDVQMSDSAWRDQESDFVLCIGGVRQRTQTFVPATNIRVPLRFSACAVWCIFATATAVAKSDRNSFRRAPSGAR